jgi:hypothetical protein
MQEKMGEDVTLPATFGFVEHTNHPMSVILNHLDRLPKAYALALSLFAVFGPPFTRIVQRYGRCDVKGWLTLCAQKENPTISRRAPSAAIARIDPATRRKHSRSRRI